MGRRGRGGSASSILSSCKSGSSDLGTLEHLTVSSSDKRIEIAKQKKLQLSPPPLTVDSESSLKRGIEATFQNLEPANVAKPSRESALKLRKEESIQSLELVTEDDFAKPSLNDTKFFPATGAGTEVDTNVSRTDDAEEQTEVLSNQGGLLSNPSPPSDSNTHGEKPVLDAKSLPEALAKFSKPSPNLAIERMPTIEAEPDPAKPFLNCPETIPASSPVSEPDIIVPPNDDAEEQTDVLPVEGDILSDPSQPSDSAINGEKPVPESKSLPEALAKFSKCPITLQLRERPQFLPQNSTIILLCYPRQNTKA